jgi:hypothetical protein
MECRESERGMGAEGGGAGNRSLGPRTKTRRRSPFLPACHNIGTRCLRSTASLSLLALFSLSSRSRLALASLSTCSALPSGAPPRTRTTITAVYERRVSICARNESRERERERERRSPSPSPSQRCVRASSVINNIGVAAMLDTRQKKSLPSSL